MYYIRYTYFYPIFNFLNLYFLFITGNETHIKFKPVKSNDESSSINLGESPFHDYSNKFLGTPPPSIKSTTNCPIVSGQSIQMHLTNEIKSIESPKPSLSSSWVVDMSDQDTSGDIETNVLNSKNTTKVGSSNNSKSSSLGYFIDLSEMKNENITDVRKNFEKSKSDSPKINSTEFFIDLSDTKTVSANQLNIKCESIASDSSDKSDKNNMFCMFIDLGEKKKINKREPPLASQLTRSLNQKSNQKTNINNNDNKPQMREVCEETRDFTPLYERPKNNSMAKLSFYTQRHSWNSPKMFDDNNTESNPIPSYSRSSSLSNDKQLQIMDKISLLSKSSSLSIDSPLSPLDNLSCTKSNITTESNSLHSNYQLDHNRKNRRDAKINETFDKSSQGSITDGIFSKDTSPLSSTGTDEVTFQNDTYIDSTAPLPPINENIVQGPHTMETLNATIEKQKQLLETVSENVVSSPKTADFVKLSDMDIPIAKFELHSSLSHIITANESRAAKLFAENRNSKSNMSRSTGNNAIHLNTSYENSISLSRLFPHLSKGECCLNLLYVTLSNLMFSGSK